MPKHVVYVYNKKKKKNEYRTLLHVDGKSDTKDIYTQCNRMLQYSKKENVYNFSVFNKIFEGKLCFFG
jgi:hypothetical protein